MCVRARVRVCVSPTSLRTAEALSFGKFLGCCRYCLQSLKTPKELFMCKEKEEQIIQTGNKTCFQIKYYVFALLGCAAA
jgi:hypothetical protein